MEQGGHILSLSEATLVLKCMHSGRLKFGGCFVSGSLRARRHSSTRRHVMRSKRKLLRMVLLLALTPVASGTTWYVNGVSGE